ncbi:hypothetical protein chiPu_0026752, partial [Chiloscyllium punctatum]|nr:hypothetical protein [Chiloscyllium punctatum]
VGGSSELCVPRNPLYLSGRRYVNARCVRELPGVGAFQTVQFLKDSVLTVRMKNNVKWELTKELVCRHFLKELRVSVPQEALRIPGEPITRWGEYWCEVT